MDTEWPHICYHRSHWNSPVLAVDRWEQPNGGGFYACSAHSEENGHLYRIAGYTWSRLPDTAQAQPTSKGVNQ